LSESYCSVLTHSITRHALVLIRSELGVM